MTVEITIPQTERELTEFVLFHDQVYASRSARWPVFVPMQLPMLSGQGPVAKDRVFKPLEAKRDGEIVARAVAIVDGRHQEVWGDFVGHINMFEALPDAGGEVSALIDTACEWLAEEGMKSARAGFGVGEFPFVIDDYESLPPPLVRQNPAYYHRMLKDSRFESEKGWVDYKIRVTPERIREWERNLARAEERGFQITPIRDVSPQVRVSDFTSTWNDAFKNHWANTPLSEEEFDSWFTALEPMGFLDVSVMAYRDGNPIGVVWAGPEATALAAVAPGRELADSEKVNFLGIGVREEARGLGVNLAMASYSYLQLAKSGHSYVSYTLVVDDNWPSRRTAEKLGAFVCANYLVYRRDLTR